MLNAFIALSESKAIYFVKNFAEGEKNKFTFR
jgi:hypothetical protein